MRSLPWLLSLLFAASVLHAQSSSFQPSFQVTQFPTGCPSNAAPVQIFTGDFNGDHITDLVIACGANPAAFSIDQFSVLLGKGDGTFQAPIVTSIASTPVHIYTSGLPAITAMDVNGDGKLDLGVNATYFNVILGNGDGAFQTPKQTIPMYGTALFGLDLNQDGRTDLVQQAGNIGGVIFYLAQADGTFESLSTLNLPIPVLVADFNGDGKPDMAGWTAFSGSYDQVSVMINTTVINATTGAANGAS